MTRPASSRSSRPQILRMIPSLCRDPDVTRLATWPCRSFPRPDPIWTNPRLPPSQTELYFACEASEPRLRLHWDGANRYESGHPGHVGVVADVAIGHEGLAFKRDRIYSFTPETGIHESLRYLARFGNLELDPGRGVVSIESPGDLTSEPDVYYERRRPADAIRFAGLRALYESASDLPETALPRDREVRTSDHDTLVGLVGKRSYVYYFLVTHILPILCLLKDDLLDDPEAEILTTGHHDEFFTLLGIAPQRLVTYDPGTLYRCKSAYLSTPVPFLAPPRELLELVRPAYVDNGLAPKDRVVFIRRTTGQRTAFRNQVCEKLRLDRRQDFCVLENHDEILDRLGREFPRQEIVDFDSDVLSVREQIELFAQARVIIGAHGSGLANMVFAAPGTQVLELMPQKSLFPVFWHLAAALGLSYWLHAVPGVSKFDNFSVPAAEIVGAVRAMLTRAAS